MEHAYDRANGASLTSEQHDQLAQYEAWLADEGAQAGGIGPREAVRLAGRHLADSLAFGRCLDEGAAVTDVGSGAGLPGIPLAIAHPNREFTLNDRSGRRVDLLERAIRTIGLSNARTHHGDVHSLAGALDLAVARAVFQPSVWVTVAQRVLRPGGRCVVGVSAGTETPPSKGDIEVIRHEIGLEILDRAVSFLTMAKRE